jgi:hypothetical protein
MRGRERGFNTTYTISEGVGLIHNISIEGGGLIQQHNIHKRRFAPLHDPHSRSLAGQSHIAADGPWGEGIGDGRGEDDIARLH